ncbi:hypothetical protein EI94DRAFT_1774628 [Lactarius quietus]|nr:hypothetical protein EI94DRAFT_1774628 [Lactarius quietus]
MYDSINSISAGRPGWTTYKLSYNGPKPNSTPPLWMQESYELNIRDVLSVFEEQLALRELDSQFEYMLYEEYDLNSSQIYSNLMSGNWAYCEADTISEDKNMHGSMLIPVVASSDKMTVSVVTGHQEYHPVYVSLGNITNTTWCGHGNGVDPIAFLPIPKSILGPYIANYPEQIWLTGVVSKWCPKNHQQSHKKTDILIKTFSPCVLWDDFGVCHNIVPFTYSFPCADIHKLLAPDLLHQLIKGVFKDHLVEWVLEYLHVTHGEKVSLEIIEDIDHQISAVPPFSGLCRFLDGHDYKQWTGNNSKVLMKIKHTNHIIKVFLTAITGYLPSMMVCSIAAFMDAYMYHKLPSVFIQAGVHNTLSLPCQHTLMHFYHAIHLFRSPNGLCSSITKSKHIETAKDTWKRTSQYYTIYQMLRILAWLSILTLQPCSTHQPAQVPSCFHTIPLQALPPEEPIAPPTIEECPAFDGTIKLGMKGMEIGCVLAFFSFKYRHKNFCCMLINWFVHADECDPDTGMWVVKQDFNHCGKPTIEDIHLDYTAWAAHLLPIYGQSRIPEEFEYHTALDTYNSFFINHYVDYHAHKFIDRD